MGRTELIAATKFGAWQLEYTMCADSKYADTSLTNRRDHYRSCPLLMGKIVRARPGAQGRSRRGATIAAFALTLISLFLLIFFPCCNAVLFCSAYVSLDNINREAVESVAMSDTTALAQGRAHELLTRYTNPLLTLYQPVQLDPHSAAHLMIAVSQKDGDSQYYDATRTLPRDKQPGFKDNRSRLSYSYRLQIDCVIRPFFNLSSIPVVGQTAIIGRATPVSVSATAPIENLGSLNSADNS